MIRLLHTADLHLDASFPHLGEREELRREDLLKVFERLVNLAIKNDVQLFVVAGDLFDTPRPGAAVASRVREGLRRLADRGILAVLLPGCREGAGAADSVYRRTLPRDALVLDGSAGRNPVCLRLQGKTIHLYGLAHRFSAPGSLAPMARRSGEGLHIGLLHGPPSGEETSAWPPAELAALDLDYLALGHFHNFRAINAGERLLGCYPGSPEGLGFGEAGARYCALATVEEGGATLEKVVSNRRILGTRSLDASVWSGEEEAAAAVVKLGDKDRLLHLVLTGAPKVPLDMESLRRLSAEAFFHLEIEDGTELWQTPLVQKMAEEEGVYGVLTRRIQALLEKASAEHRPLVENAFRELLCRFRSQAGGDE